MCVICYKPEGMVLPKKKEIKSMWHRNPDGAGIMWQNENGDVLFAKGFMTLKQFTAFLYQHEQEFVKARVAMHFRITTHGGTSQGNCHPFAIDSKVDSHTLDGQAKDVLMHNGMLTIEPRYKDISDSAELALRASTYDVPRHFIETIADMIGSNKLIIFSKGEEPMFVGDWKEKDGYKYSNLSHDICYDYASYSTKSLSSYYTNNYYKGYNYNTRSWYDDYDNYNDYDDGHAATQEQDEDVQDEYVAIFDWSVYEWVDMVSGEVIDEKDILDGLYETDEVDDDILALMCQYPTDWREHILDLSLNK